MINQKESVEEICKVKDGVQEEKYSHIFIQKKHCLVDRNKALKKTSWGE